MAYTNSKMVVCTKLSPNHSGQRTHSIDRISPHCVVGQVTAESLGNNFSKSSYRASSNYGIDRDGRVGMYVEEKNRSWCTSSKANDQRAVTIECASDTYSPYRMYDAVFQTLIRLCVDICKRNGIKKLLWKADKSLIGQVDKQNMTVHRWFANKSCPGDYLYNLHYQIADEVNKQLGTSQTTSTSSKNQPEIYQLNSSVKTNYRVKITASDGVNIRQGAGTGYRILGAVPFGAILNVTKYTSGGNHKWGLIEYNGVKGWIALTYTVNVGKTVDELAKEVIEGKWGNGAKRRKNLIAAGYDYNAVQAKVNQILSQK